MTDGTVLGMAGARKRLYEEQGHLSLALTHDCQMLDDLIASAG